MTNTGDAIDDFGGRYLQLSHSQKLKVNDNTDYQVYMYLGKYSDGYSLDIMVVSEHDYPKVDTVQCQNAILGGKGCEITLNRISGKSVYPFQDEKMTTGPDHTIHSLQTESFVQYGYNIIYHIDDINTFLGMDISYYSFLDGIVSHRLDAESKEQRRFNKRLKSDRKYIDRWYDRRFKLHGYDNELLNFILLDRK